MTFFNPLSGSLIPPTRQAADKGRQIARSQALRKNAAAEGDRVEHQVESAEELPPAGEESGGGGKGRQQQPPRREPAPPDGDAETPPRLDVTA